LSFGHHHVPALEGIHGIALVFVLGVHTHPKLFAGGQIGVDVSTADGLPGKRYLMAVTQYCAPNGSQPK
jgi:hypothetical protein